MSKVFRPYDPEQMFLMPASMREWLPSGHLAYFISDLVDHLNLSTIMNCYEQEERGYPPYHPAMMVKVLLYAYCVGVPSWRKIAGRLEEDVAFRVLAANNTPDFRTISDFRKDHLKALSDLSLEVLKLCQKAGLVKLGHVSLDGTKVKANASKHKAMSYRRMKEEEERLKAEVEGLLKQATGMPADKAQRNFTDPDWHIMPAPGGKPFEQAYPSEKDSGEGLSVADRVRRKLMTKKGRKCYGLRKEVSEPVFGQIKQARGFRQFRLRGKGKVRAEWRLICTGHNVLRLFGAWHKGLVRQEALSVRAPA